MITNQAYSDSITDEISYYEYEKNKYDDIIKEYKKSKRNNSDELNKIMLDLSDYEYMKGYYDSMIKVAGLRSLNDDHKIRKINSTNAIPEAIEVVTSKNRKRKAEISNIVEIICNIIIKEMVRGIL